MKKFGLLTPLLFAAAIASPQTQSSSLSGKWQIHASIAGNDNDSECTFTQTGTDLTGTCGAGDQQAKISGKIDGSKVSWTYKTEYNGSELTVRCSGTLDADKITGQQTIDPFGVSGDFTATRAK